MAKITCPYCQREGSSKGVVPAGTHVRCPGCKKKFRYDGPADAAIASAPQVQSRLGSAVGEADAPIPVILDSDPVIDRDSGSDLDFSRLDVLLEEEDQFAKDPPPIPAPHGAPIPNGSPQAVSAPLPTGPLEVIVVGRKNGDPAAEPWFYSGIEFLACIDILAGLLLAGGAAIVLLNQLESRESQTYAAPAYLIVSLLCAALGAFSSGMFLYLILDVARNIRAQRYKI